MPGGINIGGKGLCHVIAYQVRVTPTHPLNRDAVANWIVRWLRKREVEKEKSQLVVGIQKMANPVKNLFRAKTPVGEKSCGEGK